MQSLSPKPGNYRSIASLRVRAFRSHQPLDSIRNSPRATPQTPGYLGLTTANSERSVDSRSDGIVASLRSRGFTVAVEIETSRGLAMEEPAQRAVDLAQSVADYEGTHAVCFTDNPGGNPHLAPETLGAQLLARGGVDVVVNLSCKDYNRNGIESRLWSLASNGFDNVLALSGDYPVDGFRGDALPVFDTDSVGMLEMIRRMNAGLSVSRPGQRSSDIRLAPTRFSPGAAVNPFKLYEGEYLTQLYKMDLKVRTGAQWLVSQIGYDARKHHELIRYLRSKHGETAPQILGSIYVLSAPAARFFGRWGIPGVAVNPDLVDLANRHGKSKDRGRAFFNEFAAKQVAILRGSGFNGVYLSGRLSFQRIERILQIADSFGPSDWLEFASEINYAQPGEFYLFEPGDRDGTASDRVDAEYAARRSKGGSRVKQLLYPNFAYRIGRIGKHWLFDHRAPGFGAGSALYRKVEKSKVATKIAHGAEQVMKVPLYGCKDCGDCSLPEIGELCPESQCVKNQRNGPCGGTRAGKCEIGEKDCIYLRAYNRLTLYGEQDDILNRPVALTDSRLKGSSSWANTFAKRDHYGRQDGEGSDAAGS